MAIESLDPIRTRSPVLIAIRSLDPIRTQSLSLMAIRNLGYGDANESDAKRWPAGKARFLEPAYAV